MGVVLAPANAPGSGQKLLQAGACELYFGFSDDAWDDAFGTRAELNRLSGFGRQANPLSFDALLDEARTLAGEATCEGAPPRLYCVFNSATYTTEQIEFIAQRYLPALADAGLAGIVVSGTHLADAAREAGLSCVASTMCAVYNASLAAYYARNRASRVILPRDIMLDEAEAIVAANPSLEYEVFLMRNGCVLSDSYCLGQHCQGQPSLCRTLRTAPAYRQFAHHVGWQPTPQSAWDEQAFHYTDGLYRGCFHENTCGLCALWRFERMGVHAYKVVGRSDAVDDLCADVQLVRRHIALAQHSSTEADFLAAMQLPEPIAALCANEGLSCYYPQVRFGN